MLGHAILGADPEEAMHAVTKQYLGNQMGDLEEALANIIEIQETLLEGVIIPPSGGNTPDDGGNNGGSTPDIPDDGGDTPDGNNDLIFTEVSGGYAVSGARNKNIATATIPDTYNS
jgi:hypothetical protein